MRSTWRILALAVMFLLVLVPLTAQADGPCPDDPELSKDCYNEAPPFFVVLNRDFEDLDRPGTGCQPIILDFPDCVDCCHDREFCGPAHAYVEETVCPMLADRVDWEEQGDQPVEVNLMCCDCATDPDGDWVYFVRLLQEDGTCTETIKSCEEGLPPGTGIDLPAPVIIGGLAAIGAVLLAAGMLVRRRTLTIA